MAEEPQELTQYTPKGHEIPIPTREQVFGDLEKVAKPRKPLPPAKPSKRRLRRPKKK